MATITDTEELRKHVVSHKELKNAIRYVFNKKKEGGRGSEKAADETASQLLNFFGYGEFITDNTLTPDERALFYFLDDEGLIRHMGGEEMLVRINGSYRKWRIKYWMLNKAGIIEFSDAYRTRKRSQPAEDPAAVYMNGEITDEMWKAEPRDAGEAEVPKLY